MSKRKQDDSPHIAVRPKRYNASLKLERTADIPSTAATSNVTPTSNQLGVERERYGDSRDPDANRGNADENAEKSSDTNSANVDENAAESSDTNSGNVDENTCTEKSSDTNSGNVDENAEELSSTNSGNVDADECGDTNSSSGNTESQYFRDVIKTLLTEIRADNYTEDEGSVSEDDTESNISDVEDSDSDTGGSDNSRSTQHEAKSSLEEDEPIYRGHSMTIGVSMLLILLYSITHAISGSQLSDVLTLIGLHCMESHPGLRSVFHFKNYFANMKTPLVRHYYCISCLTRVTYEMEKCPNKVCGKPLTDPKSKAYFIELPIETQLRNLFNRPDFANLIQHRFSRKKHDFSCIEDIYDGEVYVNMAKDGGLLSDAFPYNISFTLNTDGVPLFKSSKFSIWPVYLMINELPFKHRKQSDNMIFCGLWFGDTKPFMATFSEPIHNSLKRLEENGIDVTVNNQKVTSKAFLICSTADLPAKSILMNMVQFNGAYSCQKCNDRGETYKTVAGGCVHIFPFNTENPMGKARTMAECVDNAIEAVDTKKTINGVKGPSFLMALRSYDYVKGTSIDYMHGVLLGITKLLMKLWFSSSFSKQDFSLCQFSELVDKRLLNIKPPSFITRVPRTVSSHIKYWKASELRSWLFLYSLPVLSDLMQESYFLHYASFVQAIHLLCCSSISTESLSKSKALLTYYVMAFPSLYGDRYQTLNLHLLLHLPECVRQLGPLWAYSCFSFETANGDITRMFHGTQNVDLQILSSVNIVQLLPSLIAHAPPSYQSVIQQMYPHRLRKHVTSFHVQFLGKEYHKLLSDNTMQQLLLLLEYELPNLKFYNRALIRGELYHSKEYTRVSKRNNFTVKYFCPTSKLIKYGYIQYFGCNLPVGSETTKLFAFIQPTKEEKSITSHLTVSNELGITVPHIHLVKPTSTIAVVDINNLMGICANITVPGSDRSYICEAPNRLETD